MPKLDWAIVLDEIELNVSRGAFVAWFKKTELVEVDGEEVVVLVSNIFAKNQLEKKMPHVLLETVRKHQPDITNIRYVVSKKQLKTNSVEGFVTIPSAEGQPLDNNKQTHVSSPAAGSINDKYLFDNFVVGSSNELAFAACQAVAANPGTRYNPLFIYGGVGLGKTHLIQAVGNEIKANHPELNIMYINTEDFVKSFIQAVRTNKSQFTEDYRKADVLIVDDMQFIAGKEKTQEEFFHTFNTLHQADKQIIISSDKPPKAIPTLTDRLRSRFEWGMAIDIQMPDFETRSAIISSKASDIGLELSPEAVEFIALKVRSNIRELEGALNQIAAYCEMRSFDPSIEVVKGLIESGIASPKRITSKIIIEETCKYFETTVDEITGPKRDRSIAVPRQVAMYLLRSELKLSFPKVAETVGRKDHTTAMHSVKKISRAVALDQKLRSDVNNIKEALYV